MTYATLQDLIDRYGEEQLVELTDRADPPTGLVDAAVAGRALDDASAEIDGFIRSRYALPLPSVPALLVNLCADMARFKLFRDGAPESVREAYTDALKRLADLSAGRMKLDVAGAEPAPAPEAVQVVSQDRLFSRDRMGGF